jgi:hypothetical protein
MDEEHRELGKDLFNLCLSLTHISNVLSVCSFANKWIVKKHIKKESKIYQ